MQEDFAQLEKMAQQNRSEKGRVTGGFWKTNEFYNEVGYQLRSVNSKGTDYEGQIGRINRWIAAYPQSATARIALADLYISYAYFARGSGFSDSVGESQWKVYSARVSQAREILLEAAQLKQRDPGWYASMQLVALYEGWDKAQARDLFDQAVSFEPTFYHYYRYYAQYLEPKWFGTPGEVQRFAEESTAHLSDPDSSILYFQIVGPLGCYCRQAMEDLPHINYPKTRMGYENLTRLYGTDDLLANRFAFIASTFKDQSAAHEAFAAITAPDLSIWYTQEIFDNAHTWADAP
jgi:hypothetical protein